MQLDFNQPLRAFLLDVMERLKVYPVVTMEVVRGDTRLIISITAEKVAEPKPAGKVN